MKPKFEFRMTPVPFEFGWILEYRYEYPYEVYQGSIPEGYKWSGWQPVDDRPVYQRKTYGWSDSALALADVQIIRDLLTKEPISLEK